MKHQPARQGQATTPGKCPTLSDYFVGSLTTPADHVTLMLERGPTVYIPYPRRLKCLTICRYTCNYKGSTFFLVILRP